MTYLAMPASKSQQTRQDFIGWVDTYLKADTSQPYQYRGLDVYAAPCAVLHAFSSEADLHHRGSEVRLFGYHNGGKHIVRLAKAPRLVMIGTASFLNDVVLAVEAFLKDCEEDVPLRARAASRLPKVLQTFPIRT